MVTWVRVRAGLLARGMWWRRGITAALLGVAVLATTAAALGPLYARAASESILQDHLIQATWSAGLLMRSTVDVGQPGALRSLDDEVLRPGAVRGYGTQVRGLYTPLGLSVAAQQNASGLTTHLVWVDGQCQHLVILQGRCPDRPNEAIMSQRTVGTGTFAPSPGSTVFLGTIATPDDPGYFTSPHPIPPPIRIVGIYRPKNSTDPFWFGASYFDARAGNLGHVATVDSLFVAESEFLDRQPHTYVEADFDYPLSTSQIRLRNVDVERAAVSHVLSTYQGRDGIAAESQLLAVFASAGHEEHLVDISTLLVTLQLSLLAWLVLFQVSADAIGARGNEIAMAKLRGYSALATLRFAFAEPVIVLVAAVPLGIVLADAVTHVLADSTFVAGVPVAITWASAGTAATAFAGAVAALVWGGYQTLTRSVLDQWRHTTRSPGHGRLVLAFDIVLSVGASVGLGVLVANRQAGTESDTAALLEPGLLVFAVSIVGVRLVPLACRWLAGLTRGSRRVGMFLATRQVARQPVGLRLAAFLAVAAGLAAFAVAGQSITATNRRHRAQAEVGAPQVASVQFDPGLDPVAATHRADPDGRWAMTAATWLPDGGGSVVGTVLGVDTPRLETVGYAVSGGLDPASLSAALAPPVPPIVLTTSMLRVHLVAAALTGNVAPLVQVNFRSPQQVDGDSEGGTISDGARVYSVPVPCTRGCTLRGITWDRPISATGRLAGRLSLTGLDALTGGGWKPLGIELGVPNSWHAATALGQANDHVTISANGIQDNFDSIDGGYGGIAYSSDPSPMPAIAAPQALAGGSETAGHFTLVDLTNTSAYFTVVRTVSVLPAVLDNGVIMDLATLQDELPGFTAEANWQVWLGPNAPPNALARLAAAGLQTQGVQSTSDRVSQLARQAPALALFLLLVCAVAGAALATGGTAISISASGRRRTYELAALRAVGVPRASLLRASIAEQALLLGGAVILGVPTGLIAATIAMPAIPEFANPTPIRLDYGLQLLPTAVFAAAFVVLLILTALTAGRMLIHAAVPDRLRAAE
ncbi:MAG: FtsX-like permease family protein [Jatrophihabitantaceae bacterium]